MIFIGLGLSRLCDQFKNDLLQNLILTQIAAGDSRPYTAASEMDERER
jgi:hypothetical protein